MQVIQNKDVKIQFHNGSNIFEPNEAVAGDVDFHFIFPKNVKSKQKNN